MDFSGWDRLIDSIAKDLHSGKIKPSDLHQESIEKTYNELNTAGRRGYGKEWNSFPGDGKGTVVDELKKNLYMFSGAKNYAMLEHLNHLLYDQDGKLRPYNEFEVFARQLNRQYNRNWLQAEWQTARTAAQMAEKWQRIQADKDLFPNLEYRTVGDDRVRESHRGLDGIIRPVDDDFWSSHYPPVDWRCRCDVRMTAAPVTELPKDLPEPMFQGNVGKDGEIFTKKNNFFRLISGDEQALINQELMKLNAPAEAVYKSKTGKKVMRSIFFNTNNAAASFNSAKKITDKLNTNVQIRAHIDTKIVKGYANAEYVINGYVSDLKADFKRNDYGGINTALQQAQQQKLESVVMDFTNAFQTLNISELNKRVLSNVTKKGNSLKELIFIWKNRVVKVTGENFANPKLMDELKKLK